LPKAKSSFPRSTRYSSRRSDGRQAERIYIAAAIRHECPNRPDTRARIEDRLPGDQVFGHSGLVVKERICIAEIDDAR
jgi:hypothetical protein